jgi:tRNA modification GTPase
MNASNDNIVALATAPGIGAIGVIRISGPDAFEIVNRLFKGKDLLTQKSHTLHYGTIVKEKKIIDEVVLSLFKGPHSYTKEDVIEISCHGSHYILQRVMRLLIDEGARLARPGEFTQRAFLNGRFDLAQAEAVADLIASENETAHQAAINQMRGGFSLVIKNLRAELIHFAAMIELELDFSEEDVEFVSRAALTQLITDLQTAIEGLIESFSLGNVIKNGVPTVIAGKPNAGKSTLLNALLNEEKAIVSDIPGTTRDFIEDEMVIDGVPFRFIDTAGLRTATDQIEAMGIERTHSKMKEASLVLYLIDLASDTIKAYHKQIQELEKTGVPFLIVGNKTDQAQETLKNIVASDIRSVLITASTKDNLVGLKTKLLEAINLDRFKSSNTIVTNARHYESLVNTKMALGQVIAGIDGQVTSDFLAMDIREALYALGEITGEITSEDLLDHIFSKFCIGK